MDESQEAAFMAFMRRVAAGDPDAVARYEGIAAEREAEEKRRSDFLNAAERRGPLSVEERRDLLGKLWRLVHFHEGPRSDTARQATLGLMQERELWEQ